MDNGHLGTGHFCPLHKNIETFDKKLKIVKILKEYDISKMGAKKDSQYEKIKNKGCP